MKPQSASKAKTQLFFLVDNRLHRRKKNYLRYGFPHHLKAQLPSQPRTKRVFSKPNRTSRKRRSHVHRIMCQNCSGISKEVIAHVATNVVNADTYAFQSLTQISPRWKSLQNSSFVKTASTPQRWLGALPTKAA